MEASPRGTTPGFGKRHVQSLMYFIGRIVLYTLNVNLSVGIVAMTSKSNSNTSILDWSTRQTGILSGMKYYGDLLTELTSGFLLKRFGPSKLISSAVVVSGLSSILLPYVALNVGFEATCVLRIIDGMGQGCFYPAINAHMANWAVQAEKGVMFTAAMSGASVGSIIMLSTGGFIAASSVGWPGIYYFSGVLGLVWGVLGFIVLRDSPSVHEGISKMEKEWIKSGLPDTAKHGNKLPIPWKDILLSGRVWVLILVAFCSQWGYSFASTLIPTYLSGVLGISISKNGVLSCLPYIVKFIVCACSGIISDFLIRKKYISVWTSRRLWTCLAFYGGAVGFVILGIVSFGEVGTVILLSLSIGLHGLVFGGYMLSAMDMTPNFSGVVVGIYEGLSNIAGVTAPTLAGLIVNDKHNISQWELMFLITAGINIVGGTSFIIFGTDKVQPWNNPKTDAKI